MDSFTKTRFNQFTGRQQWGVRLLVILSLFLSTGAAWYSTTKLETRPTYTPVAPATTLAPFLHIFPSDDGASLFISSGGVGQLGGTVFANLNIDTDIGPGIKKRRYAMIYSDTVQTYDVTTAADFSPGKGESGTISITTTLGLDTGLASFQRTYIQPPPIPPTTTVYVDDLTVSLVNTDTLATDAYIVAVRSYAPPGSPPLGHQLVGSAYSVRASGALTAANKPMSLHLSYNNTSLAGTDPHTLAIFAWDANPANPHWDNLGGTLFSSQQYVSVATSRFTTYALMATPTWRDRFDEFSGLDFSRFNNVTFGGTSEQRTLVLLNTPGSGSAVSQPITPTLPIAAWGTLTFSSVVTPPTATLSVDILSVSGSEVLTNVASGTSLAGLEPTQYPALKVRVNMTSMVAGQTPALEEWGLSWEVETEKVYLPVVMKR